MTLSSLNIQTQCFHQIFAERAKHNPDQIALICGNQTVTYRELNTRANQLAHHLQAQGVEPEKLVGIYMGRSVDIVIGILGILKAGGAYVPLDPAYPKERIAFIVEETKLSIILTQQHLINELAHLDSHLISLNTDWETIAQESEESPRSNATSQNLAYVIYTSGSTGKPKGVQIPHSNISNYVQAMSQAFQLESKDIYLHTASFSFSSSVRQLMLPFSQGATVVIATAEQTQKPLALFEFIQQHQITIIDLVPSYWRACTEVLANLETERRNNILNNHLRLISSASEPLLSDIPKKWRLEFNQDVKFINMYGQTETTGIVAVYPIPDEYEDKVTIVSIGRPITNTEIYILDEHLSPVPVGEIGEMYIAGTSLARSYLNRPDLTDEKFIPNPFSNDPESRLYKSGDLARFQPNGTIKYIGRIDYQVKIRGKRVELGEIESIIALYPGVKQTVVMGKDVAGDTRLVAYIVPKSLSEDIHQSLPIKELRNYLKEKLPDFMVPSAYVLLPAFPLTPTGKLDRRALPAPEDVGQQPEETFVAPRNELELQLTKIWEKLLGVQPIGIKDNFFDLGGHSLIAVRLFQEIENSFGRILPIGILLQANTIEELANLLRAEENSAQWSSLVPIQPSGSKPPLFCIHPIGGNVLEYYILARYLGQEQPIYGLQDREVNGKQEPLSRVEDMASYYIKEIRSVQPDGPYFLVGYSFGAVVAFEMAQQLNAQGQKVSLLGLIDTKCPTFKPVGLSLTQKIQTHLTNLARLRLKQKWRYIRDRLDYHFNNVTYKDMVVKDMSQYGVVTPQYLDIIDKNIQATQNYVPQVYPEAVTLFRCSVQKPELANYPDLGWREVLTGKLEIIDVPSTHYTVLREPDVQALAAKLKDSLNNLYVNNRSCQTFSRGV